MLTNKLLAESNKYMGALLSCKQQICRYIFRMVPALVDNVYIRQAEIYAEVKAGDSKGCLKLLEFLKNHSLLRQDMLVDIILYDAVFEANRSANSNQFLDAHKRFDVLYTLVSSTFSQRITVCIRVADYHVLLTTTLLFKNANWLEREAWDFFGVFIKGHRDLRRILTDYGFSGHPLRKDYPLTGFVEISYDESLRCLTWDAGTFGQEFRLYANDLYWKWNYTTTGKANQ